MDQYQFSSRFCVFCSPLLLCGFADVPGGGSRSRRGGRSDIAARHRTTGDDSSGGTGASSGGGTMTIDGRARRCITRSRSRGSSGGRDRSSSRSRGRSRDTSRNGALGSRSFSRNVDSRSGRSVGRITDSSGLDRPGDCTDVLIRRMVSTGRAFRHSLNSLFADTFATKLRVNVDFFVVLSTFTLLDNILPDRCTVILTSLLCPVNFVVIIVKRSLLFARRASLLDLPMLGNVRPLGGLVQL